MRLVTAMAQDAGDEPAAETTAVENPAVWQAVQRLPQRQRDIIELVFCRDMTVEDASRVMGVTTGTGRVHYDRAKKTLRARLEDGRESYDE